MGSRSSSPGSVKIFFFSMTSRPVLRPSHLPTQWVSGALASRIKRPGREADHSPQTSAKFKKIWVYTSTLPYAFMAHSLIRDNFYFLIIIFYTSFALTLRTEWYIHSLFFCVFSQKKRGSPYIRTYTVLWVDIRTLIFYIGNGLFWPWRLHVRLTTA
jgi:hypothetical protein